MQHGDKFELLPNSDYGDESGGTYVVSNDETETITAIVCARRLNRDGSLGELHRFFLPMLEERLAAEAT